MKIRKDFFGNWNNQKVTQITIKNNNGFEVSILNYGCIINRVMVPDSKGVIENVILGFDTMKDYLDDSPYFGAIIGRVAGLIKDASFDLENKKYYLSKNENIHHLHGGDKGFHNQLWEFKCFNEGNRVGVKLSYTSPHGEEGYPGTLKMTVTYIVDEENTLTVFYEGETDHPTLLNVTNHSYFNLSGDLKSDVRHHVLFLKSKQFLEVNEDLLPTGRVMDVNLTPFDFREGRQIGEGVVSTHEQNLLVGNGYDHPFMLSTHHDSEIKVIDPESGRELIVETDEPSVVIYTSNQLNGDFSIRGVKARKYLGLCLETQKPPVAVNHSKFSSIILRENEIYRSQTSYKFSWS